MPDATLLGLQQALAGLILEPEEAAFTADPDAFAARFGLPARDQAAFRRFQDRLLAYRELARLGLEEPLEDMFPITRALLEGEEAWNDCVNAFLTARCLTSPHYRDIAPTFLGWLADTGWGLDRWPWLVELAHFEFLETLVARFPEDPPPRGLELELKAQYARVSFLGSVTLQEADDHNAEFYRVPDDPQAHIGFPKASASLPAQWRFLPGWSFNPGLLYLGPREYYGYGATTLSRQPSTTTLDTFLAWDVDRHLQAGLRVANAGNTRTGYIQPYGYVGVGGNPPLPGPGREVDLKLTFRY